MPLQVISRLQSLALAGGYDKWQEWREERLHFLAELRRVMARIRRRAPHPCLTRPLPSVNYFNVAVHRVRVCSAAGFRCVSSAGCCRNGEMFRGLAGWREAAEACREQKRMLRQAGHTCDM